MSTRGDLLNNWPLPGLRTQRRDQVCARGFTGSFLKSGVGLAPEIAARGAPLRERGRALHATAPSRALRRGEQSRHGPAPGTTFQGRR